MKRNARGDVLDSLSAAALVANRNASEDNAFWRRRADLYIKRVLALPGASYVPQIRTFFGLSDPSDLPEYASSTHVAVDLSAISPS